MGKGEKQKEKQLVRAASSTPYFLGKQSLCRFLISHSPTSGSAGAANLVAEGEIATVESRGTEYAKHAP